MKKTLLVLGALACLAMSSFSANAALSIPDGDGISLAIFNMPKETLQFNHAVEVMWQVNIAAEHSKHVAFESKPDLRVFPSGGDGGEGDEITSNISPDNKPGSRFNL